MTKTSRCGSILVEVKKACWCHLKSVGVGLCGRFRASKQGKEMKEIKFRAWDTSGKWGKMLSWDYLREDRGMYGTLPISFIQPHKNFIFMQYTGLKDKNGKECYWDDWVTDGINPKFLVTPDYHLLARLSEIEFEILGNKYEG